LHNKNCYITSSSLYTIFPVLSNGVNSAVGTALIILSTDFKFNFLTPQFKKFFKSTFEKLPIGLISPLEQSYSKNIKFYQQIF